MTIRVIFVYRSFMTDGHYSLWREYLSMNDAESAIMAEIDKSPLLVDYHIQTL